MLNTTKIQVELCPCDKYRQGLFCDLLNDLLTGNDRDRAEVAALCGFWGFDAHTGGHHVAILQGKTRLAVVTSGHPDFN